MTKLADQLKQLYTTLSPVCNTFSLAQNNQSKEPIDLSKINIGQIEELLQKHSTFKRNHTDQDFSTARRKLNKLPQLLDTKQIDTLTQALNDLKTVKAFYSANLKTTKYLTGRNNAAQRQESLDNYQKALAKFRADTVAKWTLSPETIQKLKKLIETYLPKTPRNKLNPAQQTPAEVIAPNLVSNNNSPENLDVPNENPSQKHIPGGVLIDLPPPGEPVNADLLQEQPPIYLVNDNSLEDPELKELNELTETLGKLNTTEKKTLPEIIDLMVAIRRYTKLRETVATATRAGIIKQQPSIDKENLDKYQAHLSNERNNYIENLLEQRELLEKFHTALVKNPNLNIEEYADTQGKTALEILNSLKEFQENSEALARTGYISLGEDVLRSLEQKFLTEYDRNFEPYRELQKSFDDFVRQERLNTLTPEDVHQYINIMVLQGEVLQRLPQNMIFDILKMLYKDWRILDEKVRQERLSTFADKYCKYLLGTLPKQEQISTLEIEQTQQHLQSLSDCTRLLPMLNASQQLLNATVQGLQSQLISHLEASTEQKKLKGLALSISKTLSTPPNESELTARELQTSIDELEPQQIPLVEEYKKLCSLPHILDHAKSTSITIHEQTVFEPLIASLQATTLEKFQPLENLSKEITDKFNSTTAENALDLKSLNDYQERVNALEKDIQALTPEQAKMVESLSITKPGTLEKMKQMLIIRQVQLSSASLPTKADIRNTTEDEQAQKYIQQLLTYKAALISARGFVQQTQLNPVSDEQIQRILSLKVKEFLNETLCDQRIFSLYAKRCELLLPILINIQPDDLTLEQVDEYLKHLASYQEAYAYILTNSPEPGVTNIEDLLKTKTPLNDVRCKALEDKLNARLKVLRAPKPQEPTPAPDDFKEKEGQQNQNTSTLSAQWWLDVMSSPGMITAESIVFAAGAAVLATSGLAPHLFGNIVTEVFLSSGLAATASAVSLITSLSIFAVKKINQRDPEELENQHQVKLGQPA